MSPFVSTRRLLLISLSMYPIAVILVISVHGSNIVSNPNKNAVNTCTINIPFHKIGRKVTLFFAYIKIFEYFCTHKGLNTCRN